MIFVYIRSPCGMFSVHMLNFPFLAYLYTFSHPLLHHLTPHTVSKLYGWSCFLNLSKALSWAWGCLFWIFTSSNNHALCFSDCMAFGSLFDRLARSLLLLTHNNELLKQFIWTITNSSYKLITDFELVWIGFIWSLTTNLNDHVPHFPIVAYL